MGQRIVGVANIPLEKYCKKMLSHLNSVSGALRLSSPNMLKQDKPSSNNLLKKIGMKAKVSNN
jgi:hypothetical protein